MTFIREGKVIKKGIKRVMIERNNYLNSDGSKPPLVCEECKTIQSRIIPKANPRCCCRYILSREPDFLEQKSWLEETISALGMNLIFYPKYHCELNFIEMVWGWMKNYHRKTCTCDFADHENEKTGLLCSKNVQPLSAMHNLF